MPAMQGDKLAFALRGSFPDNPPLLIALSGSVVRLAELQDNGAFDHHFIKPVDVDGLLHVLAYRVVAQDVP